MVRRGPASAGLLVGSGAVLLVGCTFQSVTPTVVGDPSPGYVRIVSNPPQSTTPLTIRFRDAGFPGNPSTVYFEVAAKERVLIVHPSTPGNGALQVNDTPCDGGWSIASNVETDVVVHLAEASCRVEVVGSHAVGVVHTDPQTEPQVDGH